MGILQILASAETSSDLKHYSEPCSVDVLKAVGMASVHVPHYMSLYRIKYLNDAREMRTAKDIFIRWTRNHMIRRGMDAAGSSRAGVQALTYWICDTCECCHGLGYQVVEGAPSLSDNHCGACKGLGKAPIRVQGPLGDVLKDTLERADSAVETILKAINEKLQQRA